MRTDKISILNAKSPLDGAMKIEQRLANIDFFFIEAVKFLDIIEDDKFDDQAIEKFIGSWDDLRPDTYMADGGNYRFRRHAILTAEASGGTIRLEPHGPHY